MKKIIPVVILFSVLLVSAAFFGCQEPKPEKSTCLASSEITPDCTDRGWPESSASYQSGAVKHLSLYMMDPLEIRGSNQDQTFRIWDCTDLWGEVDCPASFFGRLILLPVSAVMNPPWKTQFSRSVFDTQDPSYELSAPIAGQAINNPW